METVLATIMTLAIGVGNGAAAAPSSVLGEPGVDLKTWRSDDGLPSDAVIALSQTPDGYLWVGTNAGLARFDGARFAVFDRRTTPELPSDQCGPLLVDGSGTLWIGGMAGGLTRYAGGTFTSFGRAAGSTFEYIIGMVADRHGRLWLGTNDRLHVFDGRRFKAFGPEDGVAFERPSALFEDASDRFWVQGLRGGYGYFDHDIFHESSGDGEIVPRGFPRPVRSYREPDGSYWLTQSASSKVTLWSKGRLTTFEIGEFGPTDAIGRILVTRAGDAWVGTRGSGLRLIHDGRVTAIGAREGLPSGTVSALFEDREGDVWVGTSGGLTRIKRHSFASLGSADGLELERTWAVFEDRRGDMWFGTDGVAWRLHDGRVRRFGAADGLPSSGVTSFAEDRDGTLWIGSTGGLSRLSGERLVTLRMRDGLPNDNVRALYADRDGRLWIGTAGGLAMMESGRFKSYTTASGLAGDWVRFIHEDASGSVWLATTSGLCRLKDGAFTTFRTKDGLPDDRVMAIHETGDGALWLGTYRGGLSRYKDGRFATISRTAGLHDDTVLRILEDDHGFLWMSSPHGIFRVARVQLDAAAAVTGRSISSIVYDKTDGLPTIDCGGGTQPAGWRARDGKMWFPMGRGVAVVDPASVGVNAVPPDVLVEDVLYDRVHSGGPQRARLPAGSKTVEFHYTATLLSAPDRIRFRYRLEPFDTDWVDAGTRRVAYFTALRPGAYRFHVTAANESGVWNAKGAVYDLRVDPFFYQTPAFVAACVLAAGLLGFGVYRLRVRQIELRYAAVLRERGRIARELHDTIAQGFTGVSMQLEAASAKLSGAPDEVKDNLDRARTLVRTSLSDARRSVRALRPHLLESGDLAASLRAVASQLTAGTDVRATVSTHGRKRRLPPPIEDALFRVGQEAMTNAVRHGACRSLDVDLRVTGGVITLHVKDDGSGFDPEATREGSGISGMKERLARLGGSLAVSSTPGRGTQVTAWLGLRERPEDAA